MDHVDVGLEPSGTGQQASVGQEVNAHVGPDRDQPAQGMKPTDQKFMSTQEGTGGDRRRWDAHFGPAGIAADTLLERTVGDLEEFTKNARPILKP
jgi:hypothetical protein